MAGHAHTRSLRATVLPGASALLSHTGNARHASLASRTFAQSAAGSFATIGAEARADIAAFAPPGTDAVANAFARRARGLGRTASRLSARCHTTGAAALLGRCGRAATRGLARRCPARIARHCAIGVVCIRRTALDFRILASALRCGRRSGRLLLTLHRLTRVLASWLLSQRGTNSHGHERRGNCSKTKSVHDDLLEVDASTRLRLNDRG